MAFNLHPDPDGTNAPILDANAAKSFTVSPEPVVAETSGPRRSHAVEEDVLPRSYGSEMLCLMGRDPHTLFAYWDIDWGKVFANESAKEQKVLLRVLNMDGSEHTSLEIEAFAGNCYVPVRNADAAYRGEIGFFARTGEWNAVARSETVSVPALISSDADEPADFATVPFHLSFQRMIDVLKSKQKDAESLTGMLADLQARAVSAKPAEPLTFDERELVRVIDETAEPRSESAAVDLWKTDNPEKILGFGNSSPAGGFGGS